MPQLRVEPLGVTVSVAEDQTLLQAALAQGMVLRSACRNGTCRECLARLIDGEVHYRVDWPGVLPDERADGWTLPCVALPVGDVVLLAPTAVRA